MPRVRGFQTISQLKQALQLRSSAISESLGHHGSEIMDGERVG
jgi:hypothetical protein